MEIQREQLSTEVKRTDNFVDDPLDWMSTRTRQLLAAIVNDDVEMKKTVLNDIESQFGHEIALQFLKMTYDKISETEIWFEEDTK